jgi:hypothetical protein
MASADHASVKQSRVPRGADSQGTLGYAAVYAVRA